jgi:hypothetical protein
MAAMDALDEPDDLTDDDVVAHRTQAAAKLDQIVRQTKQALIDPGIDLGIFFVIPSSGYSIITFGTMSDPPDELWGQVSAVVSSIVRQAVGLDRVRCREVMCIATDSVADHPPRSLQPGRVNRQVAGRHHCPASAFSQWKPTVP